MVDDLLLVKEFSPGPYAVKVGGIVGGQPGLAKGPVGPGGGQ